MQNLKELSLRATVAGKTRTTDRTHRDVLVQVGFPALGETCWASEGARSPRASAGGGSASPP